MHTHDIFWWSISQVNFPGLDGHTRRITFLCFIYSFLLYCHPRKGKTINAHPSYFLVVYFTTKLGRVTFYTTLSRQESYFTNYLTNHHINSKAKCGGGGYKYMYMYIHTPSFFFPRILEKII